LPAELLRLLYRQVRALVGPRQDLDDLVQSAVERALRTLPQFEHRALLSTWTYSVAYRTVIDNDRWYRRYLRRFASGAEQELFTASADHDSEALAVELTRARRLYLALDALPPQKRAALVLFDLEGMDSKQVAEIVGTNERTVRSRVRDARKKLAELLAADPLFPAEVDS
jgi:RNA polymerase sigma-70 factor (ECF subfamily)